jgi:protein-disulfide isomerase
MDKPSSIVALIIGAVAGFLVGRTTAPSAPMAAPTQQVAQNGQPTPPRPAQPPRPQRPSDDPNLVFKVAVDDSPIRGNPDAKVTIIEFSDFQCPFCSRAATTIDQVREQYGQDVRIVYKQNPLPFHQNAMPAATASLAAGKQGKFWEMYDLLFKNQQKLGADDLNGYAQSLGLNMDKFKADMASAEVKAQITKEQQLAASLGASGTPAFFINGHKLVGAQPIDSFKSVIDAQKAIADKKLADGTKPSDLYAALVQNGVTAPPMAPQGAPQVPDAPVNVAIGDSPVRGPSDAPVTIIEFSDFQCPFCSRGFNTLNDIEGQYKGKVKVVFKQNPLPFHQNAKPAAEASLAAGEQGKFWEMYEQLFKNQQKLGADDLNGYAQAIGLDMGKFKAAMESHKFASKVDEELKQGQAAGVSGTPTFVINGHKLVGAQPADAFKKVIDEELAKKK